MELAFRYFLLPRNLSSASAGGAAALVEGAVDGAILGLDAGGASGEGCTRGLELAGSVACTTDAGTGGPTDAGARIDKSERMLADAAGAAS